MPGFQVDVRVVIIVGRRGVDTLSQAEPEQGRRDDRGVVLEDGVGFAHQGEASPVHAPESPGVPQVWTVHTAQLRVAIPAAEGPVHPAEGEPPGGARRHGLPPVDIHDVQHRAVGHRQGEIPPLGGETGFDAVLVAPGAGLPAVAEEAAGEGLVIREAPAEGRHEAPRAQEALSGQPPQEDERLVIPGQPLVEVDHRLVVGLDREVDVPLHGDEAVRAVIGRVIQGAGVGADLDVVADHRLNPLDLVEFERGPGEVREADEPGAVQGAHPGSAGVLVAAPAGLVVPRRVFRRGADGGREQQGGGQSEGRQQGTDHAISGLGGQGDLEEECEKVGTTWRVRKAVSAREGKSRLQGLPAGRRVKRFCGGCPGFCHCFPVSYPGLIHDAPRTSSGGGESLHCFESAPYAGAGSTHGLRQSLVSVGIDRESG